MRRICLDGNWSLIALSPEKNNYGIKDGSSFEITMPTSVQDALIEVMVVPDPYYAENELETMFIGKSDWASRVHSTLKLPRDAAMSSTLRRWTPSHLLS